MGWAGITLFAHAIRVVGAVWSWIPGCLLLLLKNAFLHVILCTKVFWLWQGCIVAFHRCSASIATLPLGLKLLLQPGENLLTVWD